MLRFLSAAVLTLVAAFSAAPAHAQWFLTPDHKVKQIFHINNDWPYPFVYADREAVALPTGMEVANGWRRQNLLQDYHFDDRGHLNNMGEAKVRWVLTQAPLCRRTLFVMRTVDDQLTADRNASVRQFAVHFLPPGMPADILDYNTTPYCWPADEVDRVNTKFNSSFPSPRISGAASPGTAPASGSQLQSNPNAGPGN